MLRCFGLGHVELLCSSIASKLSEWRSEYKVRSELTYKLNQWRHIEGHESKQFPNSSRWWYLEQSLRHFEWLYKDKFVRHELACIYIIVVWALVKTTVVPFNNGHERTLFCKGGVVSFFFLRFYLSYNPFMDIFN